MEEGLDYIVLGIKKHDSSFWLGEYDSFINLLVGESDVSHDRIVDHHAMAEVELGYKIHAEMTGQSFGHSPLHQVCDIHHLTHSLSVILH